MWSYKITVGTLTLVFANNKLENAKSNSIICMQTNKHAKGWHASG